jgi:hypothetical protein
MLKIYPDGTHSLGDTNKDQLNADLLAFLKARANLANIIEGQRHAIQDFRAAHRIAGM